MYMDANTPRMALAIEGVSTDLQVLEFQGREALNQPYRFDIELISTRPDLDLDSLMNQPAYLSFGPAQAGVHGVIDRVLQGDAGARLTRYGVSLRPRLSYLKHRHNQRIFQHLTVPQIIARVLEDHGILPGDYRFDLGAYVYPARDYCVQYGESDLHFVQRLCEEEGLSYFFEHSSHSHVLVFGDNQSAFPKLPPLTYQQGSGLAAAHEVVSAFGVRLETRSNKASFRDYDFEKPKVRLAADATNATFPALEVYDYPGRFTERMRGKHLAKQALERVRSDYALAEGQSDANLVSGHFLALLGHPRAEWNDLWLIQEVHHEGKQPQVLEEWVTSDVGPADGFQQAYRNRFVATPWDIPYRPPLAHPKPTLLGSQTAVVTGPPGEEIHCDEYGRVKVQFHWDRDGAADDKTSCWLRVASNWAGDGYGGVAVPRVGTEVLVTFLEGDPDQPLITGCLYHKEHAAPYELPANKTRSVFKTLSSPGGEGYNELRIEDRKGQEQIYIHAERDWDENVEHDQKIRVGHERHDTVEANSYTEYQAEEHRTTYGDRKTEVRSDDHLTVAVTQHIRIGQGLFIESGEELHYYAGSKVVIDAGMELTAAAGGSWLKLDPSGVTLNGARINMNSGGAPGQGTGIGILGPLIPWAADRAKAGALLGAALANTSPLAIPSGLMNGLAPVCGKQASGVCRREDCPCLRG
ncbi:type VI secretion system Vgr family protein [Pseudomonas sp. Marseille-QA0892]